MNMALGAGALVSCLLLQDSLAVAPRVARMGGLGAVYGGLALAGWAARHLRHRISGLIVPRRGRLVTTGPYQWIRHPVYVGITISMVGVALITRSAVGLLVVLLLFLPSEIHRAREEERAMAKTFGSEWEAYKARTPAALPGPVGGEPRHARPTTPIRPEERGDRR